MGRFVRCAGIGMNRWPVSLWQTDCPIIVGATAGKPDVEDELDMRILLKGE